MGELSTHGSFGNNPVMNDLYSSDLFISDYVYGRRFNKDGFAGEFDFIGIDETIRNLKRTTGYPVFLNIGDSSTCGWNSEKSAEIAENPFACMFTYRTYSYMLQKKIIQRYKNGYVINAGVPGYTSYQMSKYMKNLLKFFSSKKLDIPYISVFAGNNDGVWSGIEDKKWIDFKKESKKWKGERVTVSDFRQNIRNMIKVSKEYDSSIIFIMPPVRWDWSPCRQISSDTNIGERLDEFPDEIRRVLEKSIKFYEKGKHKKSSELDISIPRIKRQYRIALRYETMVHGIPFINIQRGVEKSKSTNMFADCCHTIEGANELISTHLMDFLNKMIKRKIRKHNNVSNDFLNNEGRPKDIYSLW